MEAKLNLSRQSKLVPIDKISQYAIKVFGVGSVGSHVTKALAKSGFTDIEVYDMDIVEEENLSAQAFDFRHLKMNKVDAMAQIIKESTGVDISTQHGQITEETQILPEPNTIYCCFFDSFEARNMLWNKLKDYNIIFVDGRIGQYNMRHYLVDCGLDDFKAIYEKGLNTGKASELVCGEKASASINLQIAGMITMNIINYIRGTDYVQIFIGSAEAPKNNIVRIKERTPIQSDVGSAEPL